MYTSFQQGEYYFDKRNGKEKLKLKLKTELYWPTKRLVQPKLFGRTSSVWFGSNDPSALIFPSVLLDHVGQLDNELALLVLLTGLVGLFIFPAQYCLAAITVYVSHCMKSGEQNTFLSLAAANVHHRVEQIGATLATLEWFGDQLIVIGQMSPEKTEKKELAPMSNQAESINWSLKI